MNGKKQNFLNITSNVLALVVQFAINFFVVPKIINRFGTEAIGYVNTSFDIVSYFNVFIVIFNSVAGRFISIEANNSNNKKATEYLNSVVVANSAIAGVMIFAGAIFIPNVDTFLKVTPAYLNEVKITFLLTWLSSIISLLTSVFTVGTYVKNRLDLNALRNIISYVLRAAAIVLLFTCLPMKIYFMPAATLISTVFLAITNYSLTKKLLPDIKLNPKYAKWKSIKKIGSSGIWMSITSLSSILVRGLDNFLANILFDQHAMGNLATSRTIPNAITVIINTIGTMFTPTFVYYYSKGKFDDIIEQAKNSIKVNGMILLVPVSGFIAFATPFYSLWLKTSDTEVINTVVLLSSLTVVQSYFNSSTAALAQLSVVTNKLKLPVFVSLGTGILNILAVLVIAKTTNLGVITLALTSTIVMSARYVFFNSWYAAKVLNTSSKQFYKTLLRTLSPIPILLGIFFFISTHIVFNSWLKLLFVCAVCGVFGYALSAVIIFPIKDLKALLLSIKSKIKN